MDIDRDFVIDQLESMGSPTKILGNDILIICPFHPDSNPSCRVDITGHKVSVGVFHCYSCDAAGNWHKLAQKLGLDSGAGYVPENPFGAKNRAAKKMLEEADKAAREQFRGHMPAGHVPWEHGSFRGLPESFLSGVGARRYYDDKSEVHRIVFPVKNKNGVTIGSAARRLDKNSFMPWLNAPGPWARGALFPIHILKRPLTKVVLVEGPFDALRLNYVGIPTLSILGTANWTPLKLSTLEGMGVQQIVICMDGDKAGRMCEARIFNDTDGVLKRKRFRLPIENPSIDPGNMSEELIETLREFVGPLGKH